ncbi:MAG TPA: hypothetical protein RMI29_21365 [Polyangiaceae bacterium LLY-WYZ-15_(1-7)]|nr:hypothetical protein [Polyangiaceae bacterium LLY-WYZ-15_(1-7)]HJL23063.1 hypothetical protein [Polyangiaceae bacterium LLY-WYZ-15_(1-7)]
MSPRSPSPLSPRPVSPQLLVLAGALAVWSVWGEASFVALLGAYALAWLLLQVVALRFPAALRLRLASAQRLGVLALLALVSAVALWRAAPELRESERLDALVVQTRDRLRLEATPSIAPPVLLADQPQVFFVHAPSAERVRARLADAFVDAQALGHGLFRLAYDPRRDGRPARDGDHAVALEVDGERVGRTLRAVVPQPRPRWLRPAPDRRFAVGTSEETDQVFAVAPEGLRWQVEVGDGPTDALPVGARVVVAHRFEDALRWLDGGGRALGATPLPGRHRHLAASPAARTLAVSVDGPRRGVAFLEPASPSAREVAFVPLDAEPEWLAFGPDDDTLVVSTRRPAALLRLRRRPAGWAEEDARLLARPAASLARSPAGDAVLIAATDHRADGDHAHLGNHFVQDQLLVWGVADLRLREQRLTARRTPRQGNAGAVDRGLSPMGLDWVDAGEWRVAFAGSDEAWSWGPAGEPPRVHAADDVPLAAPHGVAAFAGGGFALASPVDGTVGLFGADGRLDRLVRLAPEDDRLLVQAPRALQRRLGGHGFYEGTRSGVSCQSCHLHGDTDGALRNIGGRRLGPTLPLGGVAGTAPYLRDASYPRVADLHRHLAATLLGGYRRRAPARALNLEAFVEDLPRRPPPLPRAWLAGPLPADALARARAGVDAFAKARCPTCHAFPAFTHLGAHPAGALFPEGPLAPDELLDTPSLLSVATHPPFLADGRAPTLRAVLEDHGVGRHGHADALEPAELDALLAFLEIL